MAGGGEGEVGLPVHEPEVRGGDRHLLIPVSGPVAGSSRQKVNAQNCKCQDGNNYCHTNNSVCSSALQRHALVRW